MVAQMNKRAGSRQATTCCSGLQGLLSPRLFKALSDPKRIELLVRMAEERDACTVGQVAEGSGVDLSVVSRHLAVLREAGIIKCEKRGKQVWCVVQTGAITKVLRDLADALEACCPDGWCVEMQAAAPEKKTRRGNERRKRS
jgi:DNA-binding transcriptional ArsR family regulator